MLGANDGIISTASLIMGVAAATGAARRHSHRGGRGLGGGRDVDGGGRICLRQLAGRLRGAPIWRANSARCASSRTEERQELAHIYEERGLKPKLARQVAGQLMAKDALDAHARDELGLNERAQPKADPGRLRVGSRLLGRRRAADADGVSRAARRRR